MPEFPDFASMTERQRAEWMQAHKDDPDYWGEPIEGRRVKRRRLGVMYSLRMSAEQFEHISIAARSRGLTISAFVRQAAISAANDQQPTSNTDWGTIVKFKRSA